MATSTTRTLEMELTLASTWILDPSLSTLSFRIRKFFWHPKGRFAALEGSLERSNDSQLQASFRAPTSSVRTGIALRDWHLRTRHFFDAKHHPTLTFESTSFRLLGDGRARVEGRLTIKGETRPWALEATLELWDDGLQMHATGAVDRSAFGVVAPRVIEMGGLMLGRTAAFTLDAMLRRQPNAAGARAA